MELEANLVRARIALLQEAVDHLRTAGVIEDRLVEEYVALLRADDAVTESGDFAPAGERIPSGRAPDDPKDRAYRALARLRMLDDEIRELPHPD